MGNPAKKAKLVHSATNPQSRSAHHSQSTLQPLSNGHHLSESQLSDIPSRPLAEHQKEQNRSSNSLLRGIGMNHTTWNADNGAKTIYFIRHAQALHNVANDFSIHDPRLTPEGVRQAQRLTDGIPADALANVQLIVTSPLKRTIQTTLLAFQRKIDWQGTHVALHPDLQEVANEPCDTGSHSDALLSEFPTLDRQIRELPPNWYSKAGGNAPTPEALSSRADRMKQWLLSRPEKVIVVVCHNGFLKYLVGHLLWSSGGRTPAGFRNAEARRFILDEDGNVGIEGVTTLTRNSISSELEAVGYLD